MFEMAVASDKVVCFGFFFVCLQRNLLEEDSDEEEDFFL